MFNRPSDYKTEPVSTFKNLTPGAGVRLPDEETLSGGGGYT
jgi:hypothetical protein